MIPWGGLWSTAIIERLTRDNTWATAVYKIRARKARPVVGSSPHSIHEKCYRCCYYSPSCYLGSSSSCCCCCSLFIHHDAELTKDDDTMKDDMAWRYHHQQQILPLPSAQASDRIHKKLPWETTTTTKMAAVTKRQGGSVLVVPLLPLQSFCPFFRHMISSPIDVICIVLDESFIEMRANE
jgi:hypothetical protein